MSAEQKTLGQIVYEDHFGNLANWKKCNVKDHWESVAKAVQAEDRKRLAEKVEELLRIHLDRPEHPGPATGIRMAIRIIKEEM